MQNAHLKMDNTCVFTDIVHALVRDEKEGRSKQGQTNNKAKQHSTPKAVTFPQTRKSPGMCSTAFSYWTHTSLKYSAGSG